jgi:hypothetical protein
MSALSETTYGPVTVAQYGDNAPVHVQQAVHREWATRPADQRFKELADLKAKVDARRQVSLAVDVELPDIEVRPVGDHELRLVAPKLGEVVPTNWAFGQTASLVGAPGAYLRKLPAPLAAECLQYGLQQRQATREQAGVQLYAADFDDRVELRATTSQSYGRIWDADVVDACDRIVSASNGEYFSPLAWSKDHRALFASDRDVFMFFCNGGSLVDGGGERDQLFRGFYVWNSEVGAATFGLATFLFRVVCGNFQIWDMKSATVLKIRHTMNAPDKFIAEALPALSAYTQEGVQPLEAQIRRAKAYLLPAKEDDRFEFFQKKGFTRAEVKRAQTLAEVEEGQFATLWDAVNGYTAAARMLAYADAQVDLSKRAGKLMDLVQN